MTRKEERGERESEIEVEAGFLTIQSEFLRSKSILNEALDVSSCWPK